jgi:outer membrane protein
MGERGAGMKKRHPVVTGTFAIVIALLLSMPGLVLGAASPATPLWEFGLFNTAARLPHYRGSDEYQWYVLPIPYFIYRGKILRANREGVRGVFLDSEHFEMNLSLWGNPPVTGDSDARDGMDELDALIEAGPALKWYFSGRDPEVPFYLQAALRGACSIDFDGGVDLAYQGLHGAVNLVYLNRRLFKARDLSFGVNLGVDFADSRLNGYFYEVPQSQARPDRPQYEADAGYAGASLAVSLLKKLTDRLSLVLYSRWENVSGAVFEDSPLVKRENNLSFATVLIWKIAESKRPAESYE